MPELGDNNHAAVEKNGGEADSPPGSPAIHFEPVIQLPLIDVSTNEEEEEEMIKLRAKLYRYDTTDGRVEWKERGTGEVKLLRHMHKNTVRVVMRRDKTLKLCANHFVWPWMELKPNCGSDRAWIWSALADFADDQPKPQLLAIRFANVENAKLWKDAFEKAKKIVESECEAYSGKPDSHDDNEDECESSISDDDEEVVSKEKETCTTNNSKEQDKDTEEVKKTADEVTTDLEKLKVEEQE